MTKFNFAEYGKVYISTHIRQKNKHTMPPVLFKFDTCADSTTISNLVLNQSDAELKSFAGQAIPFLKNPRILAAAIEVNQQVLTPLWLKIIEEGIIDGSIKTEYAKELSELLPILNFWLTPSVYPDTAEELRHKFYFIMESP